MCGDLGWVGMGELGESSAVRAQQGLQVQPFLGPEHYIAFPGGSKGLAQRKCSMNEPQSASSPAPKLSTFSNHVRRHFLQMLCARHCTSSLDPSKIASTPNR